LKGLESLYAEAAASPYRLLANKADLQVGAKFPALNGPVLLQPSNRRVADPKGFGPLVGGAGIGRLSFPTRCWLPS
jgi:hypothetical protein